MSVLIDIALLLLRFVIAVVIGVFSLYAAFRVFDKLTDRVEEWEELKRGNVAVGIYTAAVFFTMAFVIKGATASIFRALEAESFDLAVSLFAFAFLDVLVALFSAIISIFIALKVIDKATPNVDEWEELKRGNVAIALLMAIVIFSLGFIIEGFSLSMAQLLSPFSLAGLYG